MPDIVLCVLVRVVLFVVPGVMFLHLCLGTVVQCVFFLGLQCCSGGDGFVYNVASWFCVEVHLGYTVHLKVERGQREVMTKVLRTLLVRPKRSTRRFWIERELLMKRIGQCIGYCSRLSDTLLAGRGVYLFCCLLPIHGPRIPFDAEQ